MRFSLAEVANILGCSSSDVMTRGASSECFYSPEKQGALAWSKAPWANTTLLGAESDTRRVQPGDAFFCLMGERVDGHDYALEAAKLGAIAIVAARDPFEGGNGLELLGSDLPPVFIVPDVEKALICLAINYRKATSAKVIGVTGSAGKTTLKEVLAQVLSEKGETAKNHKNLNSQIGLPLSILRASPSALFWVLEVGISKPYDMDELGKILTPDIALVLNIGSAHAEGLGDKGVGYYKSRLLHYVAQKGAVFLSQDYPDLQKEIGCHLLELEEKRVQVKTFSSICQDVDCFAAYTKSTEDKEKGIYSVTMNGITHEVLAPFKGEYGAENIAAIYEVASFLGLSHGEIMKGLASAKLPEQRFSCKTCGPFTVIDDSYNSNPLSAKRMIEAAGLMANEAGLSLTLVMGEMRELGAETAKAHEELGLAMASSAAKLIFWKGDQQQYVRNGLIRAGYKGDFFPVGGGQEFSALLEEITIPQGVILFKASRSIQLERLRDIIYDLLCAAEEDNAV